MKNVMKSICVGLIAVFLCTHVLAQAEVPAVTTESPVTPAPDVPKDVVAQPAETESVVPAPVSAETAATKRINSAASTVGAVVSGLALGLAAPLLLPISLGAMAVGGIYLKLTRPSPSVPDKASTEKTEKNEVPVEAPAVPQ